MNKQILDTLKYAKSLFEQQSDNSAQCEGYKALIKAIEDAEKRMKALDIQAMKDLILYHFHLSNEELTAKNSKGTILRKGRVRRIRQYIHYFGCRFFSPSENLTVIGALTEQDHSTVVHSRTVIRNEYESVYKNGDPRYPEVRKNVDDIFDMLIKNGFVTKYSQQPKAA